MAIYDIHGNEIVEEFVSAEPNFRDIPTVAITGSLPTNKNEGEVPVYLEYTSDSTSFVSYATLKVQGASSTRYPKKNFTVKLFSDSRRTAKDKRVFRDWKKANKFVLKANWIDHSHARNIVNARIWSKIVKSRSDFDTLPKALREGHLAVDGFPIKVFANGIYQGIYTWNVPKSALYGLDDSVDEHALVQGDSSDYSGSILFRASNDNEGKWSDETHDEKPQAISNGWNRVLSFVYTSTDSEFVSNFESYFDKQSIIDQYIFIYGACIVDNLAKNQTFFTYDATKWYGGMYDMDGTWGCPPFPENKSTWYDYDTEFQTDYTVCTDGDGTTNLLYEKVGRLFRSDIIERYVELRKEILSKSNIDAEFDRFMNVIPPYLYDEDVASTTGEGQYTTIPLASTNNPIQIRQFVTDRLSYVDTDLLKMQTLSVSDGTLAIVPGRLDAGVSDSGYPNRIRWADATSNRNGVVALSGVSPYKQSSVGTDSVYYPIPVPQWASFVEITSSSNVSLYVSFIQYNASTGQYGDAISDYTVAWSTTPISKTITQTDNLYMVVSANTQSVVPTDYTITFYESNT